MESIMPTTAPLQLQDIHLPLAPSAWPPAIGWWIATALLIALLVYAWIRFRAYRRKKYYQDFVQQQFVLIEQKLEQNCLSAIAEINLLLRRIALRHFPPQQVASLTGRQWLEFLDKAGNMQGFSEGVGEVLATASYQKNLPESLDKKALVALVKTWLQQVSAKELA